jgi:hypothetical protein
MAIFSTTYASVSKSVLVNSTLMLCSTDFCNEKLDAVELKETVEADVADKGSLWASGAYDDGAVRHSGRDIINSIDSK